MQSWLGCRLASLRVCEASIGARSRHSRHEKTPYCRLSRRATCSHRKVPMETAAVHLQDPTAIRSRWGCPNWGVPLAGWIFRRGVLLGGCLSLGLASLSKSMADDGLTEMEALKGKDYGKPRMKFSMTSIPPTAHSVFQISRFQHNRIRSPVQGFRIRIWQPCERRHSSGGHEKSEWVSGDTVVIDWDGYTIGYYGRPFEARNKVTAFGCSPSSIQRSQVL